MLLKSVAASQDRQGCLGRAVVPAEKRWYNALPWDGDHEMAGRESVSYLTVANRKAG